MTLHTEFQLSPKQKMIRITRGFHWSFLSERTGYPCINVGFHWVILACRPSHSCELLTVITKCSLLLLGASGELFLLLLLSHVGRVWRWLAVSAPVLERSQAQSALQGDSRHFFNFFFFFKLVVYYRAWWASIISVALKKSSEPREA